MTDPTGLCFLSYRRSRGAEAALLIAALRDHGVPTWQDVSDLPTTPTEEELRRVLADPGTASAILFTTPEVEHSSVIRDVEAPLILDRHLKRDGFFAMPVAAGGLGYDDLQRVLGPRLGLAHIPSWNVYKTDTDPINSSAAAAIARLVLHQRLGEIQSRLPGGDPVRIRVATRAPLPKSTGPALSIDLTHRFVGRIATTDAWANDIIPSFRSIVHAIQTRAPNRNVELSGLVAIPAAVALGTSFLSLGGVQTGWIQDQQSFGKTSEIWALHCNRESSGFRSETHPRTAGANDIAVLVSVAADVVADFSVTAPTLPPLRAVVSISRPSDLADATRNVLTAGQALDVAHLTIDALRAARSTFHVRGTVHLFLAVPVGLAMMIGQLLNTFGPVQTYEHVPGGVVPYQRAAILTPSL